MNLIKKFKAALFSDDRIPINSVHAISMHLLDGKALELKEFAGKKLLIVNVASACGLTPQYAQLQELQETFGNQITVLGVPCNDFAGQEPGTAEEIHEFCNTNYAVTFPLTEKVNIKTEPIHSLYTFLTQKDKNGYADSTVEWNFQKYLLDEKGVLTHIFPPPTEPMSENVVNAISARNT